MPIAMETRQLDLKGVFSDSFEFEIPSYQRPYAWGAKEAQELVGDLLRASKGAESYFLGALVLVKAPDVTNASVLDGQQRLTTLTILMAVLRDMTSDRRTKDKRQTYLVQEGDEDARRKERPRLSPRPRDQAFFRDRIQAVDGTAGLNPETRTETDSQAQMLSVALVAREMLSRLPEPERDTLFRFLLNDCFLVVIAVADQRDARRIFSVLNSRGVNLTPTDILKASLLDGGEVSEADAYAKRWEQVEDRLGRSRFAELFPLLLASEGHAFKAEHEPGQEPLEEAFPKHYPTFAKPESFVGRVLEPAADFIALIGRRQDARSDLGKAGAMHLKALGRLRDGLWQTVALAHFLRLEQSAWVSQAPFLATLEQTAYFLAVTEAKPAEQRARYARLCAAACAGEPLPGLDDVEKQAFIDALNEPLYHKGHCRPVLLKLDDILANNGPDYDDPTTIEHVLPRTVPPGSEWVKAFPDPIRRSQTWPHLLGNLVFLTRSVNSRASNAGFQEKKREYISDEHGVSAYPVTMDLFACPSWNQASLEARQKRVVARLASAWGLTEEKPLGPVDQPTFQLSNRGERLALAFERDGQFTVLRGSRCLSRQFKGKTGASALRERLVAQGVIAPEGEDGTLTFQQPYPFTSPSAASGVILNRTSNGRQEWKEIGTDLTYAIASLRDQPAEEKAAEPAAQAIEARPSEELACA